MSFENIVTSIDIWSSKIRTLIWSFEKNTSENFVVLWVWNIDSTSIRKGNILDMEDFKENLDRSLIEAEKMSWQEVSAAYLCLNSPSIEVIRNKWIISVSWNEVSSADIDRVIDMAKSWIDLPNKEILKIIPEYFIVDLEEWVKNPVWMSARKIEVIANIFVIQSNIINNIRKAINSVWIEILDIYPNLLNAPEWVLTKRQKELWVVCVDIGSATTWISVYEEWSLIHANILPIAWDNVTSDIALWARVSIDIAEKLKIQYSEIYLEWSKSHDKELDYKNIWIDEDGSISLDFLSTIVSARYEEILYYVKRELKKIWKDWMLPEWVIFVWWWSKERGLLELSKSILKLPSFIWVPAINDDLVDTIVTDPRFASWVWNLILANRYWVVNHSFSINIFWFLKSILKILKKIIP